MPTYTFSDFPAMALSVDGVKTIIPASNMGATILADLFQYSQDPETGNQFGVTLRYVHAVNGWIIPSGELVMFNLLGDQIQPELVRLIKNYAKAPYILKSLNSTWGYLATDAGNFLELKPDELIELKPQEFIKRGGEYYVVSDVDSSLTINPTMAQRGVFALPDRQNLMQDYSYGGPELDTAPVAGQKYLWKLTYKKDTSEFFVKRTDQVELTNSLYETDVTQLGLAMDSQNRPQIVYTINGVSNIYWYDPSLNRYNHMELTDAHNPCISQLNPMNSTEIILAYQRGSQLIYRRYSEGYATEHQLIGNVETGLKLYQIGYTDTGKFQWMFKDQ